MCLPNRDEMYKVHSVRALSSCVTNDEANVLLVDRDMIILKYDPLLYICSIIIVFTRITIGTEDTTLVLILISVHKDINRSLTNIT